MPRVAKAFWRRSAGSVIGFASRLRDDPFFRTEAIIVSLQALFAVLIIALVAVAFTVLYEELTQNLIAGIMLHIQNQTPVLSGNDLGSLLNSLESRDLVLTGTAILIITIVFSYLLMRLALAPTQSALRAQKIFIGNVAHELRTPLSIIRTNTEVRLMDADVPLEARKIHESNLEELGRISSVINNLLTLSTFTRPEQMVFETVNLTDVARTVIARINDLARKKGIEIIFEDGTYSKVWGNPSALEEIVTNVLRNALNYTPEKGDPIIVSMKPGARGYVEMSIEDHGIGVSEQDLRHIFEPFYRADQARTRGTAGGGLGLAIVNELIKAHRGRMSIRSALGTGTRVVISFPPADSSKANESFYDEITRDFRKQA